MSASRCRHVARRGVGVREGACLAALIPPLSSGLLLWAGPECRDVCHQTAASGLQVGPRQASSLAFSLLPRSPAYQALNTTGTSKLSQFHACIRMFFHFSNFLLIYRVPHARSSLRETVYGKSKTLAAGLEGPTAANAMSNSGSIASLASAGVNSPLLQGGGGRSRLSVRSGLRSEESGSLISAQSSRSHVRSKNDSACVKKTIACTLQ